MHVISMITPAGKLEPALVASLQSAFGATDDAVWLSPDEAAEFTVGQVPGNFSDVQAELAGMSVDLNALPAENRRKKLLIADMDSTMIGQECIDELAAEAGIGEHVAEITARAMNGELDFEEALTERVGLLRGLDAGIIDHVLNTRISHAAGGKTLVATMKAHGAYAALVSGGFVQFTSRVAADLGFDENRANELIVEGGALSGDVARPILGREAKVEALEQISERLRISESDALAVGDGANDLGMIGRAGLGVAVHAKPVVAASAPAQINHGDLTGLLFLQGYARADFADV